MNYSKTDIARLASFPEQNPNPVIEANIKTSTITYLNPAAKRHFPDLPVKQIDHPLFSTIKQNISTKRDFQCEVILDNHILEQKIYFIKETDLIRVYSTDITEQKQTEKKLASLALFPEHNPNPVIEVDLPSGEITYKNPAAETIFPDITQKKDTHTLFTEIKKNLVNRKDFQCETLINERIFEQKIFFIPDTELIRIYSHDITEQKKTEKNLARLASFPEQNPSPIIEVDLNGAITYLNPASISNFPTIQELKFEHPALQPLKERFEQFIKSEIDHYSVEIKIHERYYTQRGRILKENAVIRIFNLDITQQKQTEEIIREKNKDIMDSINYAKKIQGSILPSEELLLSSYPDAFVLYRPKDIISGDFYWYMPIPDYLLFACADCTGHGVPGALMSMIGSNSISVIVNEKKVTSPDGVLTELDKRIRNTLKQDEEKSKDGMDIAFCSLQKEKMILHYSAANRPLMIIRKGELMEHTPSKFAIGGEFNPDKYFTSNKIQLEKDDSIYLFTDGFVDQFGGPLGKKLMKKRFYEFLLGIHSLKMPEQKEKLSAFFNEWKGELEQVDDVLVMGIRI